MFTYRAELDPIDVPSNVLCAYIRNNVDSFVNVYATDNGPDPYAGEDRGPDKQWVVVSVTNSIDYCMELKKTLRRLSRGKPRFTITVRSVHSINPLVGNREPIR